MKPPVTFCPATKSHQKSPILCVFVRLPAGNGNLLMQKLKSQIACSAADGYKNMTCFSPWCSPFQFYDEKQVFLFACLNDFISGKFFLINVRRFF
jgi:hypothetical protein